MSGLPREGRLLAIDLGARRIGLAICDGTQRIASPLRTVANPGSVAEAVEQVRKAARDEGAAGLVVGLPLNMDGSDSEQTREARAFADALATAAGLPVGLVDERLTTYEAGVRMRALDGRGRRDKGRRNAFAAQVILETYLAARGGE